MNKAYSTISFNTKGLDEDQRVIKGIASTPSPDRSNDIVDPMGAQFKLPIPLLSQHDHTKPIGEVIEAKVTKAGIEFTAKIAKGIAYVDEAWAQIKQGLIRGVSIGFRPIEYEEFKNADGYGMNFKKWEWFELSCVTVPANSQATISMVKALAMSGNGASTVKATPHVSGHSVVSLNPKTGKTIMKPISDQIKAFQAKHADLAASVHSVLAKAADEGRTLDDVEAESHDSAVAEMGAVEKHISRLQAAEKHAISTATKVDGTNQKSAVASRSGGGVITVRDNLAPGVEFARYARCLALAQGNIFQAEAIAKSQYPDNNRIHGVLKAAIASGTTTGTTFAEPLVEYTNFTADFINFLTPQTIIGKFGTNGIPSLRRIPFGVRIKSATTGSTGFWVGEASPVPLTNAGFGDIELRWAKVANIAVLTNELVRYSSPSAEMLMRDSLATALIQRLDIDFINPAKAAVANVSPAGVLNGTTAITASGTTSDAFKVDAKLLMANFITNNIPLNDGVWIMTNTMALSFSMMENALGQSEYPGITVNGGTLLGLPVIVSQNVPTGVVALVSASEIYLSDDGGIDIEVSREATLEMSDTPAGTATRSVWQHNEIAMMASRQINWAKRRTAAAKYISGAAYTG
jgi:HK97 family phage major capsid protein/HK97 family phage prohead protease